jgi:hypothetical protein
MLADAPMVDHPGQVPRTETRLVAANAHFKAAQRFVSKSFTRNETVKKYCSFTRTLMSIVLFVQ